ncbi:MAG: endonuclease Q family protein [Candidatus Omnitrophica bacterium]|nr:endonuclease Q family protein [Candidatus Omnitrophota bacterium]MDD5310216.1 endonuclease Q family protein [Candidatus Omnitrophota bacterium]MDD5546206.1 endonuclease Q family protein [Candidatus Omnitrophota bacterium]
MEFAADFHIHSRYSRATSGSMNVKELSRWAKIKGISLLGTGDFTHPLWFSELKSELQEAGGGLYEHGGVNFILTVEVFNNFYVEGKSKRIHNMVFVPDMGTAERLNAKLGECGDLFSDGRPILNMSARDLVRACLDVSPDCFIVPAHAWTPHFSIFGSNSGFNSVEECFKDEAKNIYCLETGLSSDPAMNWRLGKLDRYSLISNSDSHSPQKIGREANVFDCGLDYREIIGALKAKDRKKFLYTVEFYPQEGKYHYDGHRNCNSRVSPKEAIKNRNLCPVCGKKITVGVMHRVEELADRPEGFVPEGAIPFKSMIPLAQIIADARGVGEQSVAVEREYMSLVNKCGSEFNILLKMGENDLRAQLPERVAEGVIRVRNGKVDILAGYDGEYGKIKIFDKEETGEKQLTLF